MQRGQTVFAQLLAHLPWDTFRACVARYRGDHRVREFSCRDQFLTLAFAQLTARESLRDIATALGAHRPKLYHMGFRGGAVKRSTLAEANETRDWRIYHDFAHELIALARPAYADAPIGPQAELADLWATPVYVFDATTIRLCLSLFPWATFRPRQRVGGLKLHVLLDLHGNIPTVVYLTAATVHEATTLAHLAWEPGAFYLFDRGYNAFPALYSITTGGAFFVLRAKRNLQYRRCERYGIPPEAQGGRARRTSGVVSDTQIRCTGVTTHRDYPEALRRVRYYDAEHDRYLIFLTNNFQLPALTIAALYQRRWQIELFFRWIKQHLRIKAFYGTSENAVLTQVWIAIAVYVLLALVRHRLGRPESLHTISQILSVTLTEKTLLPQLFQEAAAQDPEPLVANQLSFNDL